MAEEELSGTTAELDAAEEGGETEDNLKEVIEVAVAEVGTLRKSLTITVPAQRIAEDRDKEYKTLITEAIVPGFRRGHAPRKLVEKRYGGEVGDQILTKLLSNAYLAALDKQEMKDRVLGDPLFRIPVTEKRRNAEGKTEEVTSERLLGIQRALEEIDLPDDGPLTFTCEVELKPEFELPNLDEIPVERPQVAITEQDVDSQIRRLQAIRGQWEPLQGAAVEADDLVVADMKLSSDGGLVKEQENVTLAARPQRVEGVVLDKLGQALVGSRAGDVRKVEARIPDDFDREDLRGKDAVFEFKINEIKRLRIPPMDAEYLQSLGFDTEAEYRDYVRRQMEGRLEQEIRLGMKGQIYRYLLENTKLDLPPGLSGRQIERAVVRRIIDLQRKGVPAAEIEKHADQLRTQTQEQALGELKLHFVLEKISEKLEIEVSEEEINAQIAAIARQYGQRFDRVRDELARQDGLEGLYLQTRDDKCVDQLLEKAKITQTTGPATSLSELAEAT